MSMLAHQVRRLRRERDFFSTMLELSDAEDVERLTRQSLDLVVAISAADKGYLELYDPAQDPASRAWWSSAHGLGDDEAATVRASLSGGIMAAALAAGQTIETASAILDPRFEARESVQRGTIQAAVAAPIRIQGEALGVLYLQGSDGAGAFSEEVRALVERFARHLGPVAARLVAHAVQQRTGDPTTRWRRRLVGHERLIGRSEALAATLQQVAMVAPLDLGVLLTGPSGSGKSAVARLIHESSPRGTAAFLELNCAALPDALFESELFGAQRGAHSTADRPVEGKIAAANGGTLFLDEIAELSLLSQAKLLQLLQDGTFYPLGSSTPMHADVRIVAATNADLRERVAAGRFRTDLYYRLSVMPITLPALAERREDIGPLARHFAADGAARMALAPVSLGDAARHLLITRAWPGHIRELRHAVETALVRARADDSATIAPRHLYPPAAPGAAAADGTLADAVQRFRAEFVESTLRDCAWNVSEAADRLGVARSHLYTIMSTAGIQRPTG